MTCGNQYLRLCIILLKLKSWKLLFMIVVALAVASNLLLHRSADSLVIRLGEKSLHAIGAKEFQRDNLVLSDLSIFSREIEILTDYVSNTGAESSFQQNIRNCTSESDCRDAYLQLIMGSVPGKIVHYVDYQSSIGNRTKLYCQLSLGEELYCPYMAYLVSISQAEQQEKNFFYNETNVFKLLDSIPFYKKNISNGQNTICARASDFIDVFPTTLLVQVILITITIIFYVYVSTVTCIYELKKNDYLQLMFRKGLSVFAYWLAVWTITLLEMIVFAAFLPLAYHLQCPEFYPNPKLTKVFELALAQFCCIASVVLLPTVLTRRTDLAGLMVCLVGLAISGMAVVNRYVFKYNRDYNLYRYIMLLVPSSHLAEQILATLLSDLMERKNTFVWIVLPVSAGMPILVAGITMYLDCVLKSGNGLRLSILYPLCLRFCCLSDSNLVIPAALPETAMLEPAPSNTRPIVCIRGLKRIFTSGCCCGKKTRALNMFSADIYQDQITAIVGHNGSGKSTLMQILSGERSATAGLATVDRILVTDSLTRNHICSSIGYCPQSDALVNRMSVADTVKFAVCSTGQNWIGAEIHVRHILSSLGIESKLGEPIENLSISERRKVCITIALIGDPRLVLLDDPSRDMDYISKRGLWQLLHELKDGRSIVVSTQFMDEAEASADRIVFLSCGRVICAGSTLFFKRAFDCRFIIQIACKTEHHIPFFIERFTSKFKCLRVRSVSSSDLEFEVPITEDKVLPDFIREIEMFPGLIDEFGIANYRLDDVFCRFKDLTADDIEEHFRQGTVGYVAEDYDRIAAIKNRLSLPLPVGNVAVRKSSCSWIDTIGVLMGINFKLICRSRARLFFRLIVPIVFLLLHAGSAVIEKSAKIHDIKISYNLSNTADFERNTGLCMHFYSRVLTDVHWEIVSQGECGYFITGENKSDLTVKGLVMDPNYVGKSFSELLEIYLPNVRKKCRKAMGPCPIAYSSNWCPHIDVSANHKVYVGAYVNSDNYTADSVAMTAIEVFRNMISRITLQVFKGFHSVKPDFDAVAFLNVEAIFFWLYSLFVQSTMLIVLPVMFLNDILQDKKHGIRIQLLTMGISRLKYWFCSIVCHWLQFAVIYSISIVLQVFIISSAYETTHYLAIIMPVTLSLGFVNNLLCVYLLGTVIGCDRCVAIATYVFVSLLISLSPMLIQFHNLAGRIFIYLCPQFATIALAFYGVRFIYYSSAYYEIFGESRLPSLMDFVASRHIMDCLFAIGLHFLLLIFLIALVENSHRLYAFCRRGGIYSADTAAYRNYREESIVNEIRRLLENPFSSANIMEVMNLRVVEPDGKVALKNLSLTVKSGEVMALVGPCGSGTSSAIRAIVGIETNACAGHVDLQLGDKWVPNIKAAWHGNIGYCPAFDPLYQRLTVNENLSFYASIIGLPSGRIRQVVSEFFLSSDLCNIVKHTTKDVKRRLTLAIALLSSPEFVAIENLSDGVDLPNRQLLWRCIKSQVSKRRGILIATHQMEECETLCDRLCVINHGLMVTLNSIEELLDRYKRLYLLEMQLEDGENALSGDDGQERKKVHAARLICDRFPGAKIIEWFTSLLQFAVPIVSMDRLSDALNWLVDRKSRLGIRHFTLHYASIDQTMKAIIIANENSDSKTESFENAPVPTVINDNLRSHRSSMAFRISM